MSQLIIVQIYVCKCSIRLKLENSGFLRNFPIPSCFFTWLYPAMPEGLIRTTPTEFPFTRLFEKKKQNFLKLTSRRFVQFHRFLKSRNHMSSIIFNICGNTECGRTEDVTIFAGKFKRCGQCMIQQYCSRKCQKADWYTHKTLCMKPDRVMKKIHNNILKQIKAEDGGIVDILKYQDHISSVGVFVCLLDKRESSIGFVYLKNLQSIGCPDVENTVRSMLKIYSPIDYPNVHLIIIHTKLSRHPSLPGKFLFLSTPLMFNKSFKSNAENVPLKIYYDPRTDPETSTLSPIGQRKLVCKNHTKMLKDVGCSKSELSELQSKFDQYIRNGIDYHLEYQGPNRKLLLTTEMGKL